MEIWQFEIFHQILSKIHPKNYTSNHFQILDTKSFNELYYIEPFHPMWLVITKFNNFIYFFHDLVDRKCSNL